MPNSDGTGNVADGLKHIGVALVGFLLIYLTDQKLPGFFLFVVPPLVCGAGGWFAAMDKPMKARTTTAIAWGVIGLIAGCFFYLAQ